MIYPAEAFNPHSTLEASPYMVDILHGVQQCLYHAEYLSKNRDKYKLGTLRTGIISGAIVPEH